MKKERFDYALKGVSKRLYFILDKLADDIKSKTEEIRIRLNQPVSITLNGKIAYLRENGDLCFYLSTDLPRAYQEDLEESFRLICNNSVYAHSEELRQGFIMMGGGCRAGICGTLNENGFIRSVTSINIRIAREIYGAANDLIENFCDIRDKGILIASPPGKGKTTVLRDLIRQLSSGATGQSYRVAVIDSRGELSGSNINNLGPNTDVLITADKAAGIEIALRTLNPDIIAFDEIGNLAELERVKESFHSGVIVITTAHIGSEDEIFNRDITFGLIKSGVIAKVALLPEKRGEKIRVSDVEELECGVVV